MPIPQTAPVESPYLVSRTDLSNVQSDSRLVAGPTPVFHLVHHPDNWEIGHVRNPAGELVAYWLPELSEIPVVPGVNQCRTIRRGERPEAAYLGALAWMTRRGQVAIPMDAIVGDTAGYVSQTPCRHPITGRSGVRHFDVWSRPKPTKPGKCVKFWRDNEAHNAWRLALVMGGWVMPDGTTGRLPDVDPDVIAEKIDRAKYHLARKEAETGLPERAYENEVAVRRKIVETASGAIVPRFEGPAGSVAVVDYSAALIAVLSARVVAGESVDDVIAEVPGLGDDVIAAVRAAAKAPKRGEK